MKEIKIMNVNITHPYRVIDKNIKKIDVINYYNQICNLLMPFLSNGPISEIRSYDGLENAFFKKHHSNSEELIYVNDKESLLQECQNGAIEFHGYGTSKKNKKFSILVFDFDPDENISLSSIRKGVKNLKSILDKLNIKSFLKTSGGKGYHVVIPFVKIKNYSKFEAFAKKIALLMETSWPDLYTTNIKKEARKGKIFIDYLRNKSSATCVLPYSLRARQNLPISFPISWENLNKFTPNKVTIKNFKKYLTNNPWQNFFHVKQEFNY